MQLNVSAILALLLHACCVVNLSHADDGPSIATDPNQVSHPSDVTTSVATHDQGEQKIAVRSLPGRLDRITLAADWGLSDTSTLKLRLINETDRTWRKISADGGCTCLVVDVDDIPEPGASRGESVTVTIVYSKPREPSLTPRSIHFSIDDSRATLPVLVDWYAPVVVKSLRQTGRHTWRIVAVPRENWSIQDVQSLNEEIAADHEKREDGSWIIEVKGKVEIAATCRLRFDVAPQQGGAIVDQRISIPLRNDQPRSIPARLVCRVNASGQLVGDTRLYFPRARHEGRPTLAGCFLLNATTESRPLTVSQKPLGQTVLQIEFTSSSTLGDEDWEDEDWGDDSLIRFVFEDGSHLDCPFLVSKG